MATVARRSQPAGAGGRSRFLRWVREHPLGAFLLLAFAISWFPFVAGALGAGDGMVVLGAFGPGIAAALVTRWTGGSVRTWFRGLWKWRVPAPFYLYALGLPPLLVALTNLELAGLGEAVDTGPAVEVIPEYLGTLVLVALLGGGQEEPGWRGFALDRYQAHHSPLRATLLLGLVWGAWHLPVYGLAGMGGPLMFVTFYTWLYNRTGSVLLCVLLHSSFNTAVGYLDLANQSATVPIVLAATVAVAVTVLITLTDGRLGSRPVRRAAAESGVSLTPHAS
jgi:membrane protease YdiL (CAAX protease family)